MTTTNRTAKDTAASNSTKTATPSSQQPQEQAIRAPLWFVLVSGFFSIPLLVWCLSWVVMIFLIDGQRVQTALEQHFALFLTISIGYPIAIIYAQYYVMTKPIFMTERDSRIIALTRFVGVIVVLAIFRLVYFDTLISKNIRDFLPEVPIDINHGI